MVLFHGMVQINIQLAVIIFHKQPVILIRFFRFLGRQPDTAAGKGPLPHGMNDIPANRADVKFAPFHVRRNISIFSNISRQQLRYRDGQNIG